MFDTLLNDLIPNELRVLLPGRFGVAQNISKAVYLLFQAAILNIPANGFTGQNLRDLFGFRSGTLTAGERGRLNRSGLKRTPHADQTTRTPGHPCIRPSCRCESG
ncbi:MAG: hypothetical protein JOY71_01155 [Acetobacteraceae bacterium]|nr:hypothetical protein [Acetobacteraceae bacterium]MBV8520736.1 hypothetical protein [Acetobacteraceae bacterium]MBV8591713.1 hypothetical protein [Acetobacteraceae bacterium]